jgi:5-methylcytosine-specific restriction endonuclease McrA
MTEWRDSTFLAFENQGCKCTICGNRLSLLDKSSEGRMVGHHIISRQFGDNSVSNAEARHASCEAWAHKQWKDGNPK